MTDLFAHHRQREQLLTQLAEPLFLMASLLGLHAWYRSDEAMRQTALDAENAARRLTGLKELEELP